MSTREGMNLAQQAEAAAAISSWPRLLVLSSDSESGLAKKADDLADFLERVPMADLADVEHTLQTEEAARHREALICLNRDLAISALRGFEPRRTWRGQASVPKTVFLFPGQTRLASGTGAQLYAQEPAFRSAFDECQEIVADQFPLARILVDPKASDDPSFAEAAVFSVSYALGRMWMSFGIQPSAAVGYGVGEFVAATLAGIIPLTDALTFITTRARVAHALPPGTLLAVRMSETDALGYTNDRIRLAAVEGPRLILFAGASGDIAALEEKLTEQGVPTKRPENSLIFASPKLDAISAPLEHLLDHVPLSTPKFPIFSTATNDWLSASAAKSPAHWAQHAVSAVRIGPAIERLRGDGRRLFLECGAGNALTSLVRQVSGNDQPATHCVPSLANSDTETESILSAAGQLWVRGQNVEWAALHHAPSGNPIDLSPPEPEPPAPVIEEIPPEVPEPSKPAPISIAEPALPEPDFETAYSRRISGSLRFREESATYLAGVAANATAPWSQPIVIDRAEDALLWDVDGNEYIDLCAADGALLFGHRSPLVHGAIEANWDMGMPVIPESSAPSTLARELCEFLAVERVAFLTSPIEAHATALRLAQSLTGKSKIAVFGNPKLPEASPSFQFQKLTTGNGETKTWLKDHASELAAIILDPVAITDADREFIAEIQSLAQSSGCALIADETLTGFRAGPRGACGALGITVDISVFGSLLACGLPFGLIAGTQHFLGTLSELPPPNPLSVAVAGVILHHLEDASSTLQVELSRKASDLVATMNGHLEVAGSTARWKHYSSIFSLHSQDESFPVPLLFAQMRHRGIYVWPDRKCFLTTAHTDEQIERIAAVFQQSLAAALEAKTVPALPAPPAEPAQPAKVEIPKLETASAPALVEPIAAIPSPTESLPPPPAEVVVNEAELPAKQSEVLPPEPIPADAGIDTHFERIASQNEGAVAIRHGSRSITYGTLNTQANMLAHRVGALAKQRNSRRIGVCLERGIDFVTACVAIAKTGCAFVPLDPAWPVERLRKVAKIAEVGLVITSFEYGRHFAGLTVLVDGPKPALPPPSDDPSVRTDDKTVACLLCVPGSKGVPSMVSTPHGAVVQMALSPDVTKVLGQDVAGFGAGVASEYSSYEIWAPLLNGGSIAILSNEAVTAPARLTRDIKDLGITTLLVTARQFQQVAEAAPDTFQGIRQLFIGGAPTTHALSAVLKAGAPSRTAIAHGPAELLGITCTHLVEEAPDETILLGEPMHGVTAHVLTANLKKAPVGAPGELYFSGPRLPIEYDKQTELNGERFVANPRNPKERLFRSGERAKKRDDGSIELLGRCDRQVQIRGTRVEPAEVESELALHPKVQSVIVKPLGSSADTRVLAAYFVIRAGESLSATELRAFARLHLPDAMVPSAWILLPEFPLLPNGCVNADGLTAPASADYLSATPPKNDTEAKVAVHMAAALGVPSVGGNDDFYRLGGDAVKAMDFLARLHNSLGVDLTESALSDHSTVSALSERITGIISRRPTERLHRFLAPIQRGDPRKRPLFVIPGGAGSDADIQGYALVGRQLDPSQPIWGLRINNTSSGTLPHTTVHEMASDYIREMRSIQTQGPFWLFGDSVGGVCAHEMACQLREDGAKVSRLILLDTTVPSSDELAEFLAQKDIAPDELKSKSEKGSVQSLGNRVRHLFAKGQEALNSSSPASRPPTSMAEARYAMLLMKHHLRPYPGRVSLIVNSELLQLHGQLGWENAPIGDLDLQVIAGTRGALIRDHAALVALKLKEILSEDITA